MGIFTSAFEPFRLLVRVFLARFFESETTTGVDDLKGIVFWLLAALAMPGIFFPWLLSSRWHRLALVQGVEALRESAQSEKVFYLGFAMIASGFVTAIAWGSLLPERRDTVILTAMPVRTRTIVAAKLAALGLYVLLIAASVHAVGSLFFGSMLAATGGTLFALRSITAHFVASVAASAAVALIVAAAQGLTLAVAGPRVFSRVSSVMHVALVGALAAGLAILPVIVSSVVHTIRGTGFNVRPWILATPPVWFLGLYEWLLGTTHPLLARLAAGAGVSLLIAFLVIAITYPIVYQRQLVSAGGHRAPGGLGAGAWIRQALVRAAGAEPEARAAADFLTAAVARIERHRFVLAAAVGIALAWALIAWQSLAPSARLDAWVLSPPLAAIALIVTAWQIAASLPGDVRAGWLFDLSEPSRTCARRALERVMFLGGVLPLSLVGLPLYWWFWGARVALVHAGVSIAVGAILIELLIWHAEGMPCGRRWNLERVDLGRRWPLYLAMFLVVAVGIPRLELWLLATTYGSALFIAAHVLAAAVVRYVSATHVTEPSGSIDPVAGILRLG